MGYVTQNEMDDLATMANGCLLPKVNALFAIDPFVGPTGTYPINTFYDKIKNGVLPGINWLYAIYPQPDYSFDDNLFANLIASGSSYDGSGVFNVTVPKDGTYDLILGANDTSLTDTGFIYKYNTKSFYMTAGTYAMQGAASHPVTAILTPAQGGWMQEFNRIRGDAMALVLNGPTPGGESVWLNPACVCSGPWVVGVNDQDTWPLLGRVYNDYLYYANIYFENLNGSLVLTSSEEIICYSGVRFYFATADGSPVISTGRNNDFLFSPANTATITYVATTAGTWTVNFVWHFRWDGGGTPPSAPSPSAFSPSVSGASITWSTELDAFNNSASKPEGLGGGSVGNNFYLLIGSFELSLTAGSGAVAISLTPPANYTMLTMEGYSFMEYSSESAQLADNGLHPSSPVKYIEAGVHPSNSNFTVNGELGTANWREETGIKGVWVANTLPVPGENVFIDPGIPPYVGRVYPDAWNANFVDVAIAGNLNSVGGSVSPLTTTMRQASPYVAGTPPKTTVDGVRSVLPGLTARPAKWLSMRDTDFVPFDYGFNENLTVTIYSASFADAGGLVYYNVSVPSNTTKVIIRLLQSGTARPGWKNVAGVGTWQYGEPLPEGLLILVKKNDVPTASDYDFSKSDNTVTIPSDSGGDISSITSIQGSGFNFAVYNPTGTAIGFDAYVELDTGTPQRNYFPSVGTVECFSMVLDGTPGVFGEYQNQYEVNINSKPIPQSGYCIFKVRATRLPVPNAAGIAVIPQTGMALTITVGQNTYDAVSNTLTFAPFKLADGTTNMTVTIPATAGTSDDVKVFIPVLAGNEVVYQCSQAVMFEVWANWQPIFFNQMYGTGQAPYDSANPVGAPLVTAFQCALNFFNSFNVTLPGYVQKYPGSNVGSTVQFPLFREAYDDLVAILTLLGGVLPTGNVAAGAGGTGSAGGGAGSSSGAGGGAGGGFGGQL